MCENQRQLVGFHTGTFDYPDRLAARVGGGVPRIEFPRLATWQRSGPGG